MAIRPLNSVGGFSVGENPNLIIDANGNIITSTANFSGDVNAGSIKTDTYLYANGAPVDFQVAAGANYEIQFNLDDDFDASPNLTFNTSNGGILNVPGTINTSNLVARTIVTNANANLVLDPNGTGVVVISNDAGGATGIALGNPGAGALVSNAVSLANSTSISDGIAQLNEVLGKLVPPRPPAFPASQTLSITGLQTFRMTNFVQTDNTTSGSTKSVPGGTTVSSVLRTTTYTTSNIVTAGPGSSGTVVAFLNGANAGSRTLTANLNGNGIYSNLTIFNNYDFNVANANINAGFWSVFSARATGNATQGWNDVYISHSGAGNTNAPIWYYDASTPGTPVFSNVAITAPGTPSLTFSSNVPHYNSTNQFDATFNVTRLSGDMYPVSDNFITGTSGGAFTAPTTVTYSIAGISTPLDRNLYVANGAAPISTKVSVVSGFGSSNGTPSVTVTNGYANATQTLNPGAIVLFKTGTASTMEEANVRITGSIGSGSGAAVRITNPGNVDTPSYTANATAFNSQTGPLETFDATIVGGVMRHDQTNYSVGYLPAGPNLSTGRTAPQYFTFKFARSSVSKFDVVWSGNIAGLWVALPGSTLDTSSTLNGWLDLSTAYAGAGAPGAGTGGNGSNGAALGGNAPLNSVQTARAITATFGTVSSSSTATNEIYVRIKLTSGQSVTALSLQTASN